MGSSFGKAIFEHYISGAHDSPDAKALRHYNSVLTEMPESEKSQAMREALLRRQANETRKLKNEVAELKRQLAEQKNQHG